MRPALEAWRRPVVLRPAVKSRGKTVPLVAHVDSVWLDDRGERVLVRSDGLTETWPPHQAGWQRCR